MFRSIIFVCGALIATPSYGVIKPSEPTGLADYDVRATVATSSLPSSSSPMAAPSAAEANRIQAEARLKELVPGAKVERDKLLGVPRLISARRGFLSGPNSAGKGLSAAQLSALPANDSHRVVKAFVNEYAALFGHDAQALDSARVKRDSVTPQSGLRTVVWEQTVGEIPVFDGLFVANVTGNGELVNLQSHFVPEAVSAADRGVPDWRSGPSVSAVQAVVSAAQNVGGQIEESLIETAQQPEGAEKKQILQGEGLTGPAWTELVWLPLGRDSMRLCWRVIFTARPQLNRYMVLVDAETREVLLRRSLNVHLKAASFNVYTNDSPSPFSPGWPTPSTNQPPTTNRVLVLYSNGALDTNASPAGWINDNNTNNNTIGNNADAFLDRDYNQLPDVARPTGGAGRVFNFPLNLTGAPLSYQAASTVQLFHDANYYHDRLYQLGFTESAGNFQTTNFNRGGLGNDAMICLVQAGATLGYANNATYSPAPDGIPGVISMFVFDGPTPDRDGSLDREVVFHELTHGTSDRLLGGGAGITELQTGGMGEGWSDFYALSLLSEPSDTLNGTYPSGGYVTYDFFGLFENYYFGIRRYPYTTDLSKNPLTFKDIDPTQADPHAGIPINPIVGGGSANEVHNQGEVWCVTLWEVRANLVQKLGWTNGNQIALQLVTDGLKLAPANATFLEARDAIIQADEINTGGSLYNEIWLGFAKRGMGYSAECPTSDTTVGIVEAFDLPPDVVIGEPDGILEVRITPPSSTVLFAGDTNAIFVNVADAFPVTNATIVATIGETNLVFRNDGVAPDKFANDGTYSSTFLVPPPDSVTIPVVVSALGKTNSSNSVTYVIIPLPPNDYFTNATKVPAGGTNYFTSNKRATMETNEMAHAGVSSVAASLWWNFTSPVATNILIDTGGSGFQTVVAVYTNLPGSSTINTLQPVVSAVGTATRPGAFVTYDAQAGVGYRIVVAGRNKNSVGNVVLDIGPGSLADTNAPIVAVTTPQSGVLVTTNRIVLQGTANDVGPNPSGIDKITVTLIPTPGMGQPETITVSASEFLRGPLSTNWSRNVTLQPGQNVIMVRATDFAGNTSVPVSLQVTYRDLGPVNDFLGNALALTNSADVTSANNRKATKEFGEPNHVGNMGGKSIWWWFTPSADGLLWLSTTNSTFDTLLAVYQGNHVANLTNLAGNDDAYVGAPGGFSSLTLAVRSNQSYFIVIDGYDGVSGAAFLHHAFTPGTVYRVTVSQSAGGTAAPTSIDVLSNSTAVITATPNEFFGFTGWTGDVAATDNPLAIVVTSNLSLTANFAALTYSDDFETGNLSQLGWSSAGNIPWQVQTNTVLAGSFSARSGPITNNQTSSLVLTTNFGGGTASFYFKVSSEAGWDFLKFYVDGNLVAQWSGEVGWFNYPFNLSAGLHTLEWRYVKDGNNSAGLDAAFIDNLSLPLGVPINASTPATLQITRQPGGSLLIQVLGQTNQQYVLQGTASLAPPGWENISTNVAAGGVIQYTDTGTNSVRFYRAIVPVP
ncbi:MAG TPA: M36 family metallopeptidase [Verrucomicrobiae bacterium]|nr:M36 family metallopeptidase [Verrucomicrobiae bacterium]